MFLCWGLGDSVLPLGMCRPTGNTQAETGACAPSRSLCFPSALPPEPRINLHCFVSCSKTWPTFHRTPPSQLLHYQLPFPPVYMFSSCSITHAHWYLLTRHDRKHGCLCIVYRQATQNGREKIKSNASEHMHLF